VFTFFKRHRTLFTVAALILFPLIVYRAQSRREAANTPLDSLVLALTSPLERVLFGATRFVSDRWHFYTDLRAAREENIQLRRSLITSDRKAAEAESLARENDRLRKMLDLRSRNPELDLMATSIVSFGHSPLERTVRIDRGLTHKIRPGMAVITEAGLVGRVQRVGFTSAEILLIADEKVSLDVLIARSRAHGRLRGSGLWPEYRLQMLHVLRTEDIVLGDHVVSSGLGGVFPKGVPIGVVSSVSASPDGQQLDVWVEPHVDLSRLEEVLVVRGPEPPKEELTTPELLLPEELKPTYGSTTTSTRSG
jgi:rod shape-determining protein MreC